MLSRTSQQKCTRLCCPSQQMCPEAGIGHELQYFSAGIMSEKNGRDKITQGDLKEVAALFHDAKYTARLLTEQADRYIS